MPADSASEIVKFTISIPRESCINAKAKYSSSVVPPDPSVHFYHCVSVRIADIRKISIRGYISADTYPQISAGGCLFYALLADILSSISNRQSCGFLRRLYGTHHTGKNTLIYVLHKLTGQRLTEFAF